jgi:hypothetical protein
MVLGNIATRKPNSWSILVGLTVSKSLVRRRISSSGAVRFNFEKTAPFALQHRDVQKDTLSPFLRCSTNALTRSPEVSLFHSASFRFSEQSKREIPARRALSQTLTPPRLPIYRFRYLDPHSRLLPIICNDGALTEDRQYVKRKKNT